MHEALEQIRQKLNVIVDELNSRLPDDKPFAIQQGNFQFPVLSRDDLVENVEDIISFIEDNRTDDLGHLEERVTDYVSRLEYLKTDTVQNMPGNFVQAYPAFHFTLDGLQKLLHASLRKDERAQERERAQAQERLRRIGIELRGIESRIDDLKDRTGSLDEKVIRIEHAHDAAHQLPVDMQTLKEGKKRIEELSRNVEQEFRIVSDIRGKAEKIDELLKESEKTATNILERCRTTFAAATSIGLAKAFDERSRDLKKSVQYWSLWLFASLAAGCGLGWFQIGELSETFGTPGTSTTVIALNAVLAILSVGAPIWFAWLSTKQIGQRFRLAEDYGYKASVSRAYEGFRSEAERIDSFMGNDWTMESKLLESMLTRFDELPSRLVEKENPGSPLHELVSSTTVQKAVTFPGFLTKVEAMAVDWLGKHKSSKERNEADTESPPKEEEDK